MGHRPNILWSIAKWLKLSFSDPKSKQRPLDCRYSHRHIYFPSNRSIIAFNLKAMSPLKIHQVSRRQPSRSPSVSMPYLSNKSLDQKYRYEQREKEKKTEASFLNTQLFNGDAQNQIRCCFVSLFRHSRRCSFFIFSYFLISAASSSLSCLTLKRRNFRSHQIIIRSPCLFSDILT